MHTIVLKENKISIMKAGAELTTLKLTALRFSVLDSWKNGLKYIHNKSLTKS